MSSTENPFTTMSDTDRGLSGKFTLVDYIVFSAMLVVSVAIGIWSAICGKSSTSTQEFLLGGRNMSPVPVAISLLGGVISAISIIGLPTEIYYYGTQLTTNLLGCILGTYIVLTLTLPILYNLKIVSINEYIELRFKSTFLRKMATSVQLLVSLLYMGICLYTPSLTLATVTNLSTLASILTMGTICTFYITIGGVKAVVYTDVVQTLLMFFGVLVVVIICTTQLGGVAAVWNISNQGGRIEFFNLNPSPFVRHTFWSTVTHGIYLITGMIGLNQSTYQRFASVRTYTISKGLCYSFLVGLYLLWSLFYFSGLVAFATYSTCDPLKSGWIEKTDQIIPYLVIDKVGYLTGLSGLFVSAVYGGVLSSISTSGNSIACVVWEDFLKHRPYFRDLSDRSATNVIKLLSACTGVVAMGLGILAGQLGSVFQVANSVLGSLSGPLNGLFLAGMCAPWINIKGAITGFVTAFLFNLWLVVGKLIRGGGLPKYLPLSTEECPHMNSTSFSDDDNFFMSSTEMNNLLPSSTVPPAIDDEPTIYEISYCYSGVTGIIVTIVVGSLVSLCTGPLEPKCVEERLVSPNCLRFHRWLWQWWDRRQHKHTNHDHPEVSFSMIPNIQNHNHDPLETSPPKISTFKNLN